MTNNNELENILSEFDFDKSSETNADGKTILTHKYILRQLRSGKRRIPSMRITFVDERKTQTNDAGVKGEQELLTEEVSISVSATSESSDPNSKLSEPLGKLSAEATSTSNWWEKMWPILALLLAALMLIASILLWMKGSRKRKQISAFDIAMLQLEKLEKEIPTLNHENKNNQNSWDKWYVDLSSVVRNYVESRFGLRAPELTTEEFLKEARRSSELSGEHRKLLTKFLEDCDRVKFAGYRPQTTEATIELETARSFLVETKIDDQEKDSISSQGVQPQGQSL